MGPILPLRRRRNTPRRRRRPRGVHRLRYERQILTLTRGLDPGVQIRLDVREPELDRPLTQALPRSVDCSLDDGDRPAGAGAEIDQSVGHAVDVGDVIEDALQEGCGEG